MSLVTILIHSVGTRDTFIARPINYKFSAFLWLVIKFDTAPVMQ